MSRRKLGVLPAKITKFSSSICTPDWLFQSPQDEAVEDGVLLRTTDVRKTALQGTGMDGLEAV